MRSLITLVGILLVIFGIFIMAYQGFTYTKREKVAQLGNLQLTANTEKTVYFPPMLGGGALAAGIVLVIIGRVGRPK
ncbi:MAG: DUF3185 domain-containing protein [Gammaproteobacteria bacterium]